MHGKSNPLGRNPFWASVLSVALAMVLLYAILPAGLPFTKSFGSAFSPSTNIVALRSRSEQLQVQAKRIVKSDSESATHHAPNLAHDLIIPNRSMVVEYLPALSRDQVRIRSDDGLLLPPIRRQPYPRGPPRA